MENAFSGLRNLTINATDVPDLSLVTNMYSMFRGCRLLNSPLNNWDVSNISSLVDMFNEAVSFNQDLSDWDVSNVISMGNVFNNATNPSGS